VLLDGKIAVIYGGGGSAAANISRGLRRDLHALHAPRLSGAAAR
jgi:hypothetical protein